MNKCLSCGKVKPNCIRGKFGFKQFMCLDCEKERQRFWNKWNKEKEAV